LPAANTRSCGEWPRALAKSTADSRHLCDALSLDAGKLYKLVLTNPSKLPHYFSALQFAGAVWSRKVETTDAEVEGAISEVEVLPGGELEWYFVPVKAGTFDLTVKGHAESGMVDAFALDHQPKGGIHQVLQHLLALERAEAAIPAPVLLGEEADRHGRCCLKHSRAAYWLAPCCHSAGDEDR
jgi:hypothetical protein